MEYTIKQLSDLSGVTPRTLRWYDQLGLLRPGRLTDAGYRIYGPPEVDRLQEVPCSTGSWTFLGRTSAACWTTRHMTARRSCRASWRSCWPGGNGWICLILTITQTIESSKGGRIMSDHEKFEALKRRTVEENEARYGRELRSAYGDATIDRANARVLALSEEEHRQWQELGRSIQEALAEAVQSGADPAGAEGQRIAALHRQWLSFSWERYAPQAHAGLVRLYTQDPRFTAYYDRDVPGCAAFLERAVLAWLDLT